MSLAKWSGKYFGVDTMWLRWFDRFQQRIPTGYEQAEQEAQRANRADERAERLAAQLRSLGIEPD